MANYLWGIDLGGTKIEGIISDPQDPEKPLLRERIDTEAAQGYRHIIIRIGHLVRKMSEKSGLKPKLIGFATPGIEDPRTARMKNCNTVCLNGQLLRADIENEIQAGAVLANDANCFALAESLLGAGKNAQTLFGVIMGTGVGGGVVINRQVHSGLHGIAGEWGHNVLIADGPPCYCGKNGCVETVLSGPALERYYSEIAGKNLKLADIYASRSKDPFAEKTISRLIEQFAKAIAVIINVLDPEIIVLGGGVSNIDALYNQTLAHLTRNVFNDTVLTKIVRNSLGDSAGVFGAAMLTRQ